MVTDTDIRPASDYEWRLEQNGHSLYRQQVGEPLLSAVYTRQDIAFAVCALIHHIHGSTHRHLTLARRILQYFSETLHSCLFYMNDKNEMTVEAFSNSNWVECKFTEQLTRGFVFTVKNVPRNRKMIR